MDGGILVNGIVPRGHLPALDSGVSPVPNHPTHACFYIIYYYTPLPLYLANKQASNNNTPHFDFANISVPTLWAILPYHCNLGQTRPFFAQNSPVSGAKQPNKAYALVSLFQGALQ